MLVFTKYEQIAAETLIYSLLNTIVYFVACYIKIRNSKISYYNEKQLQRLMSNQYLIFNTLPDGALIHQQIKCNAND